MANIGGDFGHWADTKLRKNGVSKEHVSQVSISCAPRSKDSMAKIERQNEILDSREGSDRIGRESMRWGSGHRGQN